jgi:Domain of unknown function (DUF4194)
MWTDHLAQELENRNLGMAEFRAVLLRLLDKQVIYRNESQVEAELYDLFVRMQVVVETYLGILGIKVFCNPELTFVIAYPPGSDIPGMGDGETGQTTLQRRIHADEAGLMITLRLLYEEKIREGEIDEKGCVFVPLETVFTRYLSITKKEMPAAEAERRSLFNTLKQLRLVEYTDLTGAEQWIGIREIIMHFTLSGIVEAVSDLEERQPGEEDVDRSESDSAKTEDPDREVT